MTFVKVLPKSSDVTLGDGLSILQKSVPEAVFDVSDYTLLVPNEAVGNLDQQFQVIPNNIFVSVPLTSPSGSGEYRESWQDWIGFSTAGEITGKGVRIGIVDTGFSLHVEELSNLNCVSCSGFRNRTELKLRDGREVTKHCNDRRLCRDVDHVGHGTNTLTLLAGKSRGLVPQAEYVLAGIGRRGGSRSSAGSVVASPSELIEAILFLAENKVQVALLNVVVLGDGRISRLEGALKKLEQEAEIVVAPVGNERLVSDGPLPLPARRPDVLAVGGTTCGHQTVWHLSTMGTLGAKRQAEVWAPAGPLHPVLACGSYGDATEGTSHSAPMVAGAAAAALERTASLPNLKAHLLRSWTKQVEGRSFLYMHSAVLPETPGAASMNETHTTDSARPRRRVFSGRSHVMASTSRFQLPVAVAVPLGEDRIVAFIGMDLSQYVDRVMTCVPRNFWSTTPGMIEGRRFEGQVALCAQVASEQELGRKVAGALPLLAHDRERSLAAIAGRVLRCSDRHPVGRLVAVLTDQRVSVVSFVSDEMKASSWIFEYDQPWRRSDSVESVFFPPKTSPDYQRMTLECAYAKRV